jgi:hypothetical protein
MRRWYPEEQDPWAIDWSDAAAGTASGRRSDACAGMLSGIASAVGHFDSDRRKEPLSQLVLQF